MGFSIIRSDLERRIMQRFNCHFDVYLTCVYTQPAYFTDKGRSSSFLLHITISGRKYCQNKTFATVFYSESVRQLPQQSINLSALSDFAVSLVQPGARASLPHYYGVFDSSHRTRTAGGAVTSPRYGIKLRRPVCLA